MEEGSTYNHTRPSLTRLQNGSGLYSQASNFINHIRTGVDARTGQFTLALTLPMGEANAMCGPSVSPNLAFSPLGSAKNNGFGRGWALTLSELNLNTGLLRLSTGDQYSLDLKNSNFNDEGELVFFDKKLESFRVISQGDKGISFRIEYKSGETETLEYQSEMGVALLVSVRSQEGHHVFIDWLPTRDVAYLLAVRDESRTLLEITHDFVLHDVTLVANPGTDQSSTVKLLVGNNQLNAVVLSDDAQSRWDFIYDEYDYLLFPSDIKNPLGSHDTIYYATGLNGHQLPAGAPLASLPRVASWVHSPGQEQPGTLTSYEWSGSNNLFGYGSTLPIDWTDGTDNLYQLGESYNYGVTETVSDLTGEELTTISRTWNRFHLQTEETVIRQGCIVRTTTAYDEDPSIPWPDQKPWCQLPTEITTEYEDTTQSPSARRTELTETRYDETGNVLYFRAATGVVEEREYYPAAGAEGCPADPYGFSRWLKQYTVRPALVEDGSADEAPTLATLYRYELLPSLITDSKAHIVIQQEQTVQLTVSGQQLIDCTTQTYVRDGGAHHGRPLSSVTTLNNLDTTTLYRYENKDNQLTVWATVTGFERNAENSVTECNVRSTFTGLTQREQNQNGVQALYEHDSLGRVVRKTITPGTLYEAIETCRFQLSGRLRDSLVSVEKTDVNGARERLYLDGDGRVIRKELEDVDNLPGTFREVSRNQYNAIGQVQEVTTLDWLPDQLLPLSLTTRYAYNGWGKQSAAHRPDGVTEHTLSDPVSLETRAWLEGSDGELAAVTVSLNNIAGSSIRIQQYDLQCQLLRTQEDRRDGLDRVIAQRLIVPSEDQPTEIHTGYDVYGRVTQTKLQDGTVVDWTYAAHSDGDHPESVTVSPAVGTPIIVGQQTFDGTGRQRSLNVFGRQTTFLYVAGLIPPQSETTARGHILQYLYEPLLDNKLIGTRGNGERADYSYDLLHAQMIRASGRLGEQTTTYAKSGKPIVKTWNIEGDQYTASSRYSLEGRLQSTTDVTGAVHTIEYDSVGRPTVLNSQSVTVSIEYDGFSRPYRTRTEDSGHTRLITQAFSYDEFGREITRTFSIATDKGPQLFNLKMTYTEKDQVATRTWSNGQQLLREESYQYDTRSRLIEYTASGIDAPTDPYGNILQRQTFTLNALDGNEKVVTEYANGQLDEASFTYSVSDPTQVTRVTHTHPSWPSSLELEYDAHGNLLKDGQGRDLVWDAQNRLISVIDGSRACHYRYTPMGLIADRMLDGETQRHFYQGDRLVNTHDKDGWVTYVGNATAVFAHSRLSNAVHAATDLNERIAPAHVMLLGGDTQGSICLEVDETSRTFSYTAHGASQANRPTNGMGFAGELMDAFTGWYMPGSYRPYDPVLMCFLSPDSESPFGRGGLNGYAYCGGDPVNNIDPDGHGWLTWVIAGIGLALAVAGTVASLGAATPAIAGLFSLGLASLTAGGAFAIASAGLGVISLTTGVAAISLEATGGDQKATSILGWVSMGTGIASTVTGFIPKLPKAYANFVGRGAQKIAAAGTPGTTRTIRLDSSGGGDVMFQQDFLGRGFAAYTTHGEPFANLLSASGKYTSATKVAVRDIAPELTAMSYPTDKPLILAACWGGRSGAAQEVANVIKRDVIGYKHTILTYDHMYTQKLMTMTDGLDNQIRSIRTNPFMKAYDRFNNIPDLKLARQTVYHPR
ncbi:MULTISPECIES: RHS repeat-associated core domain-containing protein [unclassified Pseudomonas]|uniref:RHS repeat-associated core domain-containing protein n=1 Tax=unclassified Pseudomonas TaxID=196821 RepID=UPI002AC964F8|nr:MULTISPECIES: RHS repeat-associated core domain-containing protein [unclassified Pseudomonas]MEB0042287.1 RHS repeat-associated core domain-containing protein [Pseudomonas sp. MH10]MEB0122646.1 RHS repeat-associated core domain-containing protein [Pseudomonas sp. CCI1.2]WPX65525.1 RHS repeat-associated core domain-containing protein [Pseudomonas sp. MH10]